jgi:FlaA1/EpsC-like NDP-sugar epimerase
MNKTILGSTVLVTGAGGSIGSALTKTIVGYAPRLLVLLDRSEHNLYQIETDLAMSRIAVPNASVLGDICNAELISETLARTVDGKKSDCSNSK